jgi:hypothetical protein
MTFSSNVTNRESGSRCYASCSALALSRLALARIAAVAGAGAAAVVLVNGVLDDGTHSADLMSTFEIKGR